MTPEELEQFIHRELRTLPPHKAPPGFEARVQAALEARAGEKALSAGQLEQFIHRELRSLPLRRAPRSLEVRVLSALEQRAAIAWYHKSWIHWPAAVRAAFLAVATGVAGGCMAGFYLMAAGLESSEFLTAVGARLGLLAKAYHAAVWMADFTANVFGNIPPLWLYGGLALVGALYATFFGLGAAAYRTLYRRN